MVASELEMKIIDKIYYQECSGCNPVDGILVKNLARGSTISYLKISMGSLNKIFNEYLDDESIGAAILEYFTEDSSIVDNLEDVTDSDL